MAYYSGTALDVEPHFLECCSLCRKQLPRNADIFMYRGNTPFCSKECREEQIEMDEAKERRAWKRSSSSASSSASSPGSIKKAVDAKTKSARTGTISVSVA